MEENKEFKVTDLKSADWAFDKLAEVENEIAEKTALAEEKIAKTEKWLKDETKALQYKLEYFKGLLIEYYAEQRELNPKFQLSVPAGKVSQRKNTNLKYDEAKMMDYLKNNHQDLIQTVEKFNKNDVKKVLKKDGDVVVDIETGEIVNFVQAEENTSYLFKLN